MTTHDTSHPQASILDGLNPEQHQVATTFGSPMCVLAGAGTGKTRALTHRIAYGISTGQLNPRHVLAVTFTNKAAAEMRSRLRDLGVPAVQARTFHSAALRQLRHFWPQVVGGAAPQIVPNTYAGIAEACKRLHLSVDRAAIRDFVDEIMWARVSMVTPERYAQAAEKVGRTGVAGFDAHAVARVMTQYEEVKKENHVLDFEDVLLHMVGFMADYPQVAQQVRAQYRHFFVDEYQDVSTVQHALLRLWLGDHPDVCVVGDAAQTIYTFAGARASYLVNFAREFPSATTVKLERNYRSTPQIVAMANRVLDGARGATRQHRLTLVSERPDGPVPTVECMSDDAAEAALIAERIAAGISEGRSASDYAILVRTNNQSEAFEQALTAQGVGYQVRGGERFFERREIRDAMVTLRAAARVEHPDLARAVRDVLSQRGWAPQAPSTTGAQRDQWEGLNAIVSLADTVAARPGATLADLVRELEERAEAQTALDTDGVSIASIHAAKGLEWPVVFVAGVSEGLVPFSLSTTAAQIEEERRLLYVALTRARDELTVSWAAARTPGARASRKPSRFLDAVLAEAQQEIAATAKAQPRRRGRRGATEFTHCRSCGQGLQSAQEKRRGRCEDCPSLAPAELLEQLRQWRAQRAREMNVPAYTIATNATIEAIAERRPATAEQLLQIPGVGPVTIEKHGEALLGVLQAYHEK